MGALGGRLSLTGKPVKIDHLLLALAVITGLVIARMVGDRFTVSISEHAQSFDELDDTPDEIELDALEGLRNEAVKKG
ncbi:MAG: hypothetical protein KBG75_14005 [Pseudomonadales bacterium]|nr:hypothetical protein [Pseudomonadales bacterium]